MNVQTDACRDRFNGLVGSVLPMKRTDFTFRATDGKEIQAYKWEKEADDIKGVVQIAHGMAEHALRYEPFAAFLTAHGYIVYANDHRGHGRTYKNESEKGYLADEDGFELATDDLRKLSEHIRNEHPNLPIFLLGHSFGSFLTRRYIQKFDPDLKGVLISGTGGDPKLLGKIGLAVAKMQKKLKGPKKESPLMDKLIFGSYNKRISPVRTKFDFLTRDENAVDAYIADENCGFVCKTSFYVDLLEGLLNIHEQNEADKTPKDLPIFIFSGDEDPVGDYGKGVQSVYEQLLELGCTKVSIKLYEGGRHEMLNETNKEEVYEDILNWLDTIVKGESV